jgi:hypothetical protein
VSSVGKSDHFEEAKETMPLRKTTSAMPSSGTYHALGKSIETISEKLFGQHQTKPRHLMILE